MVTPADNLDVDLRFKVRLNSYDLTGGGLAILSFGTGLTLTTGNKRTDLPIDAYYWGEGYSPTHAHFTDSQTYYLRSVASPAQYSYSGNGDVPYSTAQTFWADGLPRWQLPWNKRLKPELIVDTCRGGCSQSGYIEATAAAVGTWQTHRLTYRRRRWPAGDLRGLWESLVWEVDGVEVFSEAVDSEELSVLSLDNGASPYWRSHQDAEAFWIDGHLLSYLGYDWAPLDLFGATIYPDGQIAGQAPWDIDSYHWGEVRVPSNATVTEADVYGAPTPYIEAYKASLTLGPVLLSVNGRLAYSYDGRTHEWGMAPTLERAGSVCSKAYCVEDADGVTVDGTTYDDTQAIVKAYAAQFPRDFSTPVLGPAGGAVLRGRPGAWGWYDLSCYAWPRHVADETWAAWLAEVGSYTDLAGLVGAVSSSTPADCTKANGACVWSWDDVYHLTGRWTLAPVSATYPLTLTALGRAVSRMAGLIPDTGATAAPLLQFAPPLIAAEGCVMGRTMPGGGFSSRPHSAVAARSGRWYLHASGALTSGEYGSSVSVTAPEVPIAGALDSLYADCLGQRVATGNALLALDPVLDAPVLVALTGTWDSEGEGATASYSLVRQDVAERDTDGLIVTASEIVTLEVPSLTPHRYLLADVLIDHSGGLWIALWRAETDWTWRLYLLKQAAGAATATIVFYKTGLTRPPCAEARLALDPVLDEVSLWRYDAVAGTMVCYHTNSTAKTVTMPAVPTPPYGDWLTGTAPAWVPRSVCVMRNGSTRVRATWHGHHEFADGWPTHCGLTLMADMVDVVMAVDPLTGAATAVLEDPR